VLAPPAASPLLDRAAIAARIPHQGSMCLLDAVLACSDTVIDCRAVSHRDPANPLRADGRLGAAAGIEYAAQAMAVHGALLAASGERPRQGYLASVRGVDLWVERLDDLSGPLEIHAERLSGDAQNILYQFALRHAGELLLTGRAAVVLDAAALNRETRG
jgi:predicted hotdog family 3-hydroxylacyl-ACP dehydratase